MLSIHLSKVSNPPPETSLFLVEPAEQVAQNQGFNQTLSVFAGFSPFPHLIEDFLVGLAIEGWVATEHHIPSKGISKHRIEWQDTSRLQHQIDPKSRQSRCMMTPRLHMSAMWSYFPARTLHNQQTILRPGHLTMTQMIQILNIV